MQALFQGNMTSGMKLVGVYDDEACPIIAAYLKTHLSQFCCIGDTIALIQFVPLKTPSLSHIYGAISPEQAVILMSGSLTKGLMAVGPYPDRTTALSNAVALTFGNPNCNFYAVDVSEEHAALRENVSKLRPASN